MKLYHFTNGTLRNGEPLPEIGKWLIHEGKIIPCESGLHASPTAWAALRYAPGPILHLVKLDDVEIIAHGEPVDKYVGRKRKILKELDATNLLYEFARLQALSVTHLWDAPDIVLQYLFTGDETIRRAAESAAQSAVESAAQSAAWNAAQSAAESAAQSAAWNAAQSAAESAAQSAAERAAQSAAERAARSAAQSAVWSAAWRAAESLFNELVKTEFEEQ
jgi:hypothetical protein